MSESDDETNVDSNDDVPVIEEGTDTIEVGVIEEQDLLEAGVARADTAEKEIV